MTETIGPADLPEKPEERQALLSAFLTQAGVLFLRPETPGVLEGGDAVLEALEIESRFSSEGSGAVLQAYARLFLGVGEETISLTESVWTSPLHLTNQAAQIECARVYREAGVEVPETVAEDHLGAELLFAARLMDEGKEAEARAFWRTHPSRFLSAVIRAVRARGDAKAFLPAVELLEGVAALMADPEAKSEKAATA